MFNIGVLFIDLDTYYDCVIVAFTFVKIIFG